MKGITAGMLGILVLVAIAFGLSNFNTLSVTSVNGCSIQNSGGYLLIPQYGYFACEPIQGTVARNSVTWAKITQGFFDSEWQSLVHCPNSGFGKECNIYVDGSFRDVVGTIATGNQIQWQSCDSSGLCGAWNSKVVDSSWIQTGSLQKLLIATINKGNSVRVSVKMYSSTQPLFSLIEEHVPYGLRQYERNAEPRMINDQGCNIPINYNLCVNCILTDLLDSFGGAVKNNPIRDLSFDQFSTYLKNWVLSPYKFNVVKDIDGSDVDCSNGKVYALDTISTKGALGDSCYAFPATVKRTVECCPNEVSGNQVCGADFKWKVGNVGCVQNGIRSINYCDGQGGWVVSGSNQVKKAIDCDFSGECVYSYKAVSCTPPNIGCLSGAICSTVNGLDNPTCIGGVTCNGQDSNGDCYDDSCGQYISGCVVDNTCTKENQDVGGVLGVGKKACCAFANDGVTPLVEENNKCVKKTGIEIGTIGIGALIVIAIVALLIMNKKK